MKPISFIALMVLLLCSACIRNLSDEELKASYQEASKQQQWKKALDYVEEGLRRNPSDTKLFLSKAMCLKYSNTPSAIKESTLMVRKYLKEHPRSDMARSLLYSLYFEDGNYSKAVQEMETIESYYGVSAISLAMKANAYFMESNYEKAVFFYQEALQYPLDKAQREFLYYQSIYSKYLGGNKEGALWDIAFLENKGLSKNDALMEKVTKGTLTKQELVPLSLTLPLEYFRENALKAMPLQYTRFFEPQYPSLLFRSPNYSKEDLVTLDTSTSLLNMRGTSLAALPDRILDFQNLQAIDLSRNPIRDFDRLFAQLSQLPKLEFVVLNYTNLKNIPASIGKLQQIKGLSMEAANIRSIPPEIGNLGNLSYWSLSNNSRLKDLPKEIRYLKQLNVLDVSGSGMERLREEVAQCYSLAAIIGNASKIQSLPESIGNLKTLQHLRVGANKIKVVPESIGDLGYLRYLSLSSNDIEKLPKSIGKLQELQNLSLEFNRFPVFPMEVLPLKKLQTLWIHNNSFPEIPLTLAENKNLEYLLVDHEVISDENIQALEQTNPNLRVIREDCRQYVKGKKRKE